MFIRLLTASILLVLLPALTTAAGATDVMVIGTFHMNNPGRDLHDVHADDVLAPKRQAEIAAIVAGLARFHPTEVDVEWPAGLVTGRYKAFADGTLPPSRDEVVQLGFRLAKESGAAVHGIDADGDFPYEAVETFAKAHDESGRLARNEAALVDDVAAQQHLLDTGTVGQLLRWMNEPARIRHGNDWYSEMLHVGSGADQPGADLLAAWYKRNMHICAQMIQLANPDDRVVLIFGSGHAFLLRQCVSDMPGYRLVEPNDYLPGS
ncbi:MAG TPA: DUF5694 domain-containing protein [Rhizomicrobium sp.]|nr:DUF5694 domain-containing protein [Rhizomicrobium sp.]